MADKGKTKEQLTQELALLGQRILDLEKLEAKRKKTEKMLLDSETRFSRIFNDSPLGIAVSGVDRHFSK